MADFRDYQPSLAPAWLRGPVGTAWLRALGDAKDVVVHRLKAAVKARMPLLAPNDALALIGVERGMPRAPGESDAAYRVRLQGAWLRWPWAGTAYGLLRELRDHGYPTARLCIPRGRRFSLDGAGAPVTETLPPGGWSIDATPAFWSKFQVVFAPPLPSGWGVTGYGPASQTLALTGGPGTSPDIFVVTKAGHPNLRESQIRIRIRNGGQADGDNIDYELSLDGGLTWHSLHLGASYVDLDADLGIPCGLDMEWATGEYAAGETYSGAITATWAPADGAAEIELIRRLVRKWKPAHATCAGIVAFQGATFGAPDRTCGTAGTLGGNVSKIWTA